MLELLEHVICSHMRKHLEQNKILATLNHGFRSGFSCKSLAILDFSKAFDTVPHFKLVYKLHKNSNNNNGELIERFQNLKALHNLKKNIQCHSIQINSIQAHKTYKN